MKQAEIRGLSTEEVQLKLAEVRKEYQDLKMAHAVTPLENPMVIKSKRRSVARLSTELTKREQE